MKKNKFRRLACGIAFTTLITTILVCCVAGVFARYNTETSDSVTARVARYVLDVTNGTNSITELDISGLSPENPTKTFMLVITNTKDGQTAEVSQSYTISAELMGSIPLTFSLTSSDVNVSGNRASGTFSTIAQSHTYTLTVTWDDDYAISGADADIYDDVSLLTVSIHAEQID